MKNELIKTFGKLVQKMARSIAPMQRIFWQIEYEQEIVKKKHKQRHYGATMTGINLAKKIKYEWTEI